MSAAPGSNNPSLRELRLEHRHQRPHLRLVEQLQLRRERAHGFVVTFDLRRLFPRADHQRTARCEQSVLDEAARRPLEE